VVVRDVVLITLAQVVVCLLLVVITVHVTRLVHDAVPSTVRAGVASGVSSLTWLVFLPVSLVFGAVGEAAGVHSGGLLLTAGLVGVVVLLAVTRRSVPPGRVAAAADGGDDGQRNGDDQGDHEHLAEVARVDHRAE
jgi:hypothetical protein